VRAQPTRYERRPRRSTPQSSWLLDGKVVELAAWQPCAELAAGPDLDGAISLLEAVRDKMERRYREPLATGARKIERDAGLALRVIACDELAST
jgi:hypothetical protein